MSLFKTTDDLDKFARLTADEIKDLKTNVADLRSNAWVNKYALGTERVKDWGALVKAVVRKDTEKLANMGAGGGLPEMKPGETMTKAALGTALTSDATTGSYTVPDGFVNEIIHNAQTASELMPKVRRIPMTGRITYVPEYLTGVAITWITSQAGDNAEANPTFTRRTLQTYTGSFYVPVTEEFEEDQFVSFGAYLSQLATDAWVTAFDAAMLTSSSPFTGLLTDTGTTGVTLGTGQTSFEDVTFDDLWSCVGKLTTRAARKNAYWMLHPTVFDQLAKIKNANGDYIYMAANATGRPATLLSYPYILSDEMPAIADSNESTKFIALGNPQLMLWGDRVALEVKYFDNTHYMVTNMEGFFRVRVRAGFDIAMPQNFSIISTAAS